MSLNNQRYSNMPPGVESIDESLHSRKLSEVERWPLVFALGETEFLTDQNKFEYTRPGRLRPGLIAVRARVRPLGSEQDFEDPSRTYASILAPLPSEAKQRLFARMFEGTERADPTVYLHTEVIHRLEEPSIFRVAFEPVAALANTEGTPLPIPSASA